MRYFENYMKSSEVGRKGRGNRGIQKTIMEYFATRQPKYGFEN